MPGDTRLAELKRREQELLDDIERNEADKRYWKNVGSSDSQMADFCDNEILADARGGAVYAAELEQIRREIAEIETGTPA
jgi:hypothetical protein